MISEITQLPERKKQIIIDMGITGIIGRFKPLHNGGARLLDFACRQSKQVIIGIGSSNKYDVRNPFTAKETKEMIDAYLFCEHSNYSIVELPDMGHIPEFSDGKKWKENVEKEFGTLDCLISGNEYVQYLLKDTYHIMTPDEIIPKNLLTYDKGTYVRLKIARNDDWERYVPLKVAEYIKENNLDCRFRKEFGIETIERYASKNCTRKETFCEEKLHATEI